MRGRNRGSWLVVLLTLVAASACSDATNRASVEQSGGNVTGSYANGSLTLGLQRSNGDVWLLQGRVRGGNAAGDWSTPRSIRGTFDVSR